MTRTPAQLGPRESRAGDSRFLWRSIPVLGFSLLSGMASGLAEAETLRLFFDGVPFELEALDGVVVLTNLGPEPSDVVSTVLEAFPDWRTRSLFSSSDNSPEVPTTTLFAHPAASAAGFGVADGPGEPPSASNTLAEVHGVLPLEQIFLSPLFNYQSSCGWVIEDEVFLLFSRQSDEDDHRRTIEAVGGVVVAWDRVRPYGYRIRLAGARTAFEVMVVVQRLLDDPHVSWAYPEQRTVTLGPPHCGTGGGGGTGGSGGGDGTGGAGIVPVPVGGGALAALIALLLFGGWAFLGDRS